MPTTATAPPVDREAAELAAVAAADQYACEWADDDMFGSDRRNARHARRIAFDEAGATLKEAVNLAWPRCGREDIALALRIAHECGANPAAAIREAAGIQEDAAGLRASLLQRFPGLPFRIRFALERGYTIGGHI